MRPRKTISERKNLGDKCKVINENFLEADLSPATIVTLYLTTTGNAKLRPKFIDELRDGTRLVSHDFPIMDWVPDTEDNHPIRIGTHKIYTYYRASSVSGKTPRGDKTIRPMA